MSWWQFLRLETEIRIEITLHHIVMTTSIEAIIISFTFHLSSDHHHLTVANTNYNLHTKRKTNVEMSCKSITCVCIFAILLKLNRFTRDTALRTQNMSSVWSLTTYNRTHYKRNFNALVQLMSKEKFGLSWKMITKV